MGKSLQMERKGGGRAELWGSAAGRDCLEGQEPAKEAVHVQALRQQLSQEPVLDRSQER